jgi:hypothetical protein
MLMHGRLGYSLLESTSFIEKINRIQGVASTY